MAFSFPLLNNERDFFARLANNDSGKIVFFSLTCIIIMYIVKQPRANGTKHCGGGERCRVRKRGWKDWQESTTQIIERMCGINSTKKYKNNYKVRREMEEHNIKSNNEHYVWE
jgi:hypothetical protein